jgi:hypothetical protein
MKCNLCVYCNKYKDVFFCIDTGEKINIYALLKNTDCPNFTPALDKVIDA